MRPLLQLDALCVLSMLAARMRSRSGRGHGGRLGAGLTCAQPTRAAHKMGAAKGRCNQLEELMSSVVRRAGLLVRFVARFEIAYKTTHHLQPTQLFVCEKSCSTGKDKPRSRACAESAIALVKLRHGKRAAGWGLGSQGLCVARLLMRADEPVALLSSVHCVRRRYSNVKTLLARRRWPPPIASNCCQLAS